MGVMNSVKNAMKGRSDKVADAVDTAVRKVDERTGGTYREKLTTGADKLKGAATKLDADATADTAAASGDATSVDADPPTTGSAAGAAGAAGLGAEMPPRVVADPPSQDDDSDPRPS